MTLLDRARALAARQAPDRGEAWLRLMAEFAAAVAGEEREACILATCPDCANGNAPFLLEGVWLHAFHRNGKEDRGECQAAAIRARGQP